MVVVYGPQTCVQTQKWRKELLLTMRSIFTLSFVTKVDVPAKMK